MNKADRPKLCHAYNFIKLTYILIILACLYVISIGVDTSDTQNVFMINAYVGYICESIILSTVLLTMGSVLFSMVTKDL